MRPQQLALDAQNVPVAAAEMQHGLDPGVLLNQLARDLSTQPRTRPWPVRNVDAIDAGVLTQLRAGDFFRRIDALRRKDFDERDELTRRQLGAQSTAIRQRDFRLRVRSFFRFLHLHGLRLFPRLKATRLVANLFDMRRRGPATPAHDLRPRLQKPPRILRHIFRRAQIQITTVDSHRQPRVRHHTQRLRSMRRHRLNRLQQRPRS